MTAIAASGLSAGGLLAQLVADSTAARARMDTLTRQSSSGKVATSYGGLGGGARVSLDLRPQMAQATTWQSNIDAADTRLAITQDVLKQLSDIATSFATDSLGAPMSIPGGSEALAARATVALDQVKGLLNTRVGDTYLLSGTDTSHPPIDDTRLTTFIANVQAPVSNLATNNGTATGTTVLNLASTGTIVSTTIGTTPVNAEIGPGQTVPQGVVASKNLYQPASRSYVKDLVAGLAALAGLHGVTPDQHTMVDFGNSMSSMLQGAATAITLDQSCLGEVQADLTTGRTSLSDMVDTLTQQVASVEEVDMAATATALAQVQTQLEASYRLIAGMRELSLTSYL